MFSHLNIFIESFIVDFFVHFTFRYNYLICLSTVYFTNNKHIIETTLLCEVIKAVILLFTRKVAFCIPTECTIAYVLFIIFCNTLVWCSDPRCHFDRLSY